MVEWKPSATTGQESSENFDSEGPQTAAAVCAAEQGSSVESGCTLKIKQKLYLFTFIIHHCYNIIHEPSD